MDKAQIRRLIRNFALEVLVYAALLVGYFFLVLRFLGEPLKKLFADNLIWYAFAALALIVAQASVLELVTSFLINWLGLERLE